MFIGQNYNSSKKACKLQKVILYLILGIITNIHYSFITNVAKCSDYYLVEQPYRGSLKQYYTDKVPTDDDGDKIELSNIDEVYMNKLIAIDNEERNYQTSQALRQHQTFNENSEINNQHRKHFYASADKDEAVGGTSSKREQFLAQQKSEADGKTDNKDTKTGEKKSFLDYWLIEKDVNAFEYVGAFATIKLGFVWPLNTKLTADETRVAGTYQNKVHLFDAVGVYGLMPAVFLSAGNDRYKYWKWEFEIGYTPIRGRSVKDMITDTDGSRYADFSLSKKEISVHMLTLNFNNFGQYPILNKKVVLFAGIGLGIGYAWSWDYKMRGNFILPTINAQLGFSMMITKNKQVNFAYRLSYATFKLQNKYPFHDNAGMYSSSRSIIGGGLHFKDMMVQTFTIEYQFYTS